MPRYLDSEKRGITDLDGTTPIFDGEIIDGPPPQQSLIPVEVVDGLCEIVLNTDQFEVAVPDPPRPAQRPQDRGNGGEIFRGDIYLYEPCLLTRLAAAVIGKVAATIVKRSPPRPEYPLLTAPRLIIRRK